MRILYETKTNGNTQLKIFISEATARKKAVRVHYHSTMELSLVISGKGNYTISGQRYDIKTGDIFFLRSNEPHYITDIALGGITLLNIHVEPHYVYSTLIKTAKNTLLNIMSPSTTILSNKLNDFLNAYTIDHIKKLILKMKNEYEDKKDNFKILADCYLTEILINIQRAYPKNSKTTDNKMYEKILIATDYISNNYDKDITLEEIAKEVGYSKSYFSTLFRHNTGMYVWDYVCLKRIEKAVELIKTTDRTIIDIATSCGFNNTANFNKLFKKYTLINPRDLR